MTGVVDERIDVVDYDSRWPTWFAADSAEVGVALGVRLAAIEHFRDYLRAHASVAARYARAKRAAWDGGARTLLAYSAAKADHVVTLLAAAKAWKGGAR